MNWRWMSALFVMTSAAAIAGSGLVQNGLQPVVAATDPSQPAYFVESVQPIFQANCYRCHGAGNHRGGLNMDSRSALLTGGHHGPAIVPGQPAKSLLVTLIRHAGPADDPMNMPPAPKPKLADADIATIENWIRAGAVMPGGNPMSGNTGAGR